MANPALGARAVPIQPPQLDLTVRLFSIALSGDQETNDILVLRVLCPYCHFNFNKQQGELPRGRALAL